MAYREFTDSEGIQWRVWDTYPSSVSNVRSIYAAGWLGFESATERRRLHPVPAGWDSAPEDALCAWLAAATPVAPRQTESFLNQARPEHAETAQNHALLDATRAVVERARSVIRTVSNTIGNPEK
jgi:hypothetical protein